MGQLSIMAARIITIAICDVNHLIHYMPGYFIWLKINLFIVFKHMNKLWTQEKYTCSQEYICSHLISNVQNLFSFMKIEVFEKKTQEFSEELLEFVELHLTVHINYHLH